ncbi:MAG: BrnT family toxin [Candidatus Poribacteria bacterium]
MQKATHDFVLAQIRHVIITDSIDEKIEREHKVSSVEVDEMFFNSEERPFIRKTRDGRYVAFGRTLSGRYLTVVLVWITSDTVKVITARDMAQKEKKYYRRRRK